VVALFCGLLETDQKGMQVLLPAIAALPEDARSRLCLRVIAYGSRLEQYRQQGRELGLEVEWVGKRTLAEIADEMRAADFLVMPSLHEGMPCVLVEALACGLPVVGSAVGGIPEAVPDSCGLLAPPADQPGLTNALRRMVSEHASFDRPTIAATVARSSMREYGARISACYRELMP